MSVWLDIMFLANRGSCSSFVRCALACKGGPGAMPPSKGSGGAFGAAREARVLRRPQAAQLYSFTHAMIQCYKCANLESSLFSCCQCNRYNGICCQCNRYNGRDMQNDGSLSTSKRFGGLETSLLLQNRSLEDSVFGNNFWYTMCSDWKPLKCRLFPVLIIWNCIQFMD